MPHGAAGAISGDTCGAWWRSQGVAALTAGFGGFTLSLSGTSSSTTDGTFFEAKGGLNLNHTAEFTRDFLRKPTEHGNVLSALASRKSSDRPLHFFFAGQIRKGGERKPAAPAAPRQSVAAPYRP